MAKKKATVTTRAKSARKKKTTKKTTSDEAESAAEAQEAETATGSAAQVETSTKTAKATRRRRTRKKRVAEPQTAETAPAVAETPDSDGAPLPARSSVAQVEEHDSQIVIRFPPVASDVAENASDPVAEPMPASEPGPAMAEAPSASADAAPEGTPAPAEADAGPEPPDEQSQPRRSRRRRRRGRRPTEAVEAPEHGSQQLEEHAVDVEPTPGGEALSPSRKRRMRRRRARSAQGGEAVTAAEVSDSEARRPDEDPTPPASGTAKDEPHDDEREEQRRPGRRRRSRRRQSVEAEPAGDAIEEAEPDETPTEPGRSGTEMIVNVVPREECRIGILRKGKLEEIYLERASSENLVGNIYKGIVTNVEPSIQAAFIDFGLSKNGFLHISDLHPQYFPDGSGKAEDVGHKIPRRNRPPIQRCLRRGQEVMVQLTKEGIGTKGPTLTTYLAIPGRFVVMMPSMRRLGVSRKIEDDDLRHKLRDQLGELQLPEGIGFIARTAAQNRTKRELQSDLNYLLRLWKAVTKRAENDRAPAELYTESDLVIRTIRDVFTTDIDRIIVDNAEVAERSREFLAIFSPRSRDAVTEYTDPRPIFHVYGIEAELERLHSRHVPLKSGGSLVIDQTEALVAIDVNSGRFRTEDDAESTAYKIDMEAADEIARQLRLRDLGGVVVCDFIDLREERHRRDVERRLANNLKGHKERAKVLRMSQFGIIELTRQRQRASLTRSVYQDCRHCRGAGLVKTAESVALDVTRLVQLAVTREHISSVEIAVSPEVAHLLQNRKRAVLYNLEQKNRRTIAIAAEANYGLDQFQIRCFDKRGRQVPHG